MTRKIWQCKVQFPMQLHTNYNLAVGSCFSAELINDFEPGIKGVSMTLWLPQPPPLPVRRKQRRKCSLRLANFPLSNCDHGYSPSESIGATIGHHAATLFVPAVSVVSSISLVSVHSDEQQGDMPGAIYIAAVVSQARMLLRKKKLVETILLTPCKVQLDIWFQRY